MRALKPRRGHTTLLLLLLLDVTVLLEKGEDEHFSRTRVQHSRGRVHAQICSAEQATSALLQHPMGVAGSG
jgi:hypothetical protein